MSRVTKSLIISTFDVCLPPEYMINGEGSYNFDSFIVEVLFPHVALLLAG